MSECLSEDKLLIEELKEELERETALRLEAESSLIFQEGVIRRLEEDKRRLTKSLENYKQDAKTHNDVTNHLRLGWEQDKTMLKAKVVHTFREGLERQGITDPEVVELKVKDWCALNRI